MSLEREIACDDNVLQRGGQPRAYAQQGRLKDATSKQLESLRTARESLERQMEKLNRQIEQLEKDRQRIDQEQGLLKLQQQQIEEDQLRHQELLEEHAAQQAALLQRVTK